MAISVDEVTKVITIPQADLLFVSAGIYQLDTDALRLELRNWESSVPGSWRSITHKHNPPVTVGGVSLARVVEVINGYTITFEDGQYRVILVGSNNNILDIANVNQVSIAPTNSAGLTYSKQVEDSAFTDARVWIDTINGLPGTQYPRGTPGDPVNNLADALAIIAARRLPKRLFLRGTLNVPSGTSLAEFDVLGSSAILATLNFASTSTSSGMVVEALSITGDLSGNLTARRSTSLSNLIDFDGHMSNCGLSGSIALLANADIILDSCYSEEPGSAVPIITMSANSTLQMRNYSGGVDIRGLTAGATISVDLDPGRLILTDASNTGGTVVVRGSGDLVVTQSVLDVITLDRDGLIDARGINTAAKSLIGNADVSPDDLTVTILDDDAVTVLRQLSVSADGRTRRIL